MALFKILRGNETNLFNANGSLKKAWTDGYAYYCTDTHDFYIDHLDSNGKQVRSKLNAKEAEKLRISRSIAAGGAVTSTATGFDGTSDITIPINSVKEAYLTWGGKNFAANYGPIDAALIPVLGANRFAFLPEAGITVEYSRDNGATWTEIESENKHRLFGAYGTNYAGFTIGNNDVNGADTSAYQLRVTIDSVAAKIYTTLNKFAIYVTTAGGQNCWCSIDGKLAKNVISGTDTWKNFVSQTKIDGWSGWNIINISNMTTYSGQTSQAEAQYQKIRFTFGNESHKGANYKGLNISQIFAFGGVGWTTPSNMAKYGTIYSYDCEQNVIFPKSITQNSTSGQIYSKGTLKVDGASTLGGAVTANGNLTVKGNTTLGDAYSDTVFAKGTVTIGDNGRTYSQAQTHTLYGGLEMYKGYMYLESIDSQGYFYVDAENRGYTEISGMPLRLVGVNATLTVDGNLH